MDFIAIIFVCFGSEKGVTQCEQTDRVKTNKRSHQFLAKTVLTAAWSVSAAAILISPHALAGPQLTESPGADDLTLVSGGTATAIYVEPDEDRAVKRAAGDLAEDIARVTGVKPVLVQNPADGKEKLIIVGTLGKSKTLDRLIADGKLDGAGVRGNGRATSRRW